MLFGIVNLDTINHCYMQICMMTHFSHEGSFNEKNILHDSFYF